MTRVLFVEPFYGGSHKAFADGFTAHSRHDITLLALPGGEWRKRMRRGAIELAARLRAIEGSFDLVIATDMLDLSLFLALTRPRLIDVPVLYYLHENQLTYPRLEGTKLNSWYGQLNYASALAADAVAFNSEFHRTDFERALRTLEGQPTNWLEPGSVDGIAAKAHVLPVGVDLSRFDTVRVERDRTPLVLWNHRWEFDKEPAMFARAVIRLSQRWDGFNVAVVGDPGDNPDDSLPRLRAVLGSRLVQFGRVDDWEEYARLLWRAKVAVSTARQEFFGISMVEAMYCETIPIAPRRLNYPALVPVAAHQHCLFEDEGELLELLFQALSSERDVSSFRQAAGRWDWTFVAPAWDAAIERLSDRQGL